jgi:hypothetical protein
MDEAGDDLQKLEAIKSRRGVRKRGTPDVRIRNVRRGTTGKPKLGATPCSRNRDG